MTRRLLAVLGRDVSRSMSPMLHRAAADACDLDVAYVPVSCAGVPHFHRAVDALRVLGALGANVTIPYKLEALARCDRIDRVAQEIGAVNTLTFEPDGSIRGDNTDGPALLRLFDRIPDERFVRVQVLGAGGAARAAVWALARREAREVHVSARSGAAELSSLSESVSIHGLEAVPGATLVVSALPPEPELARAAMTAWVDTARCPLFYDLAYPGQPGETPLVALAKAQGLPATDGGDMLVQQAALALSLWTGGELSRIVEAMESAMAFARR